MKSFLFTSTRQRRFDLPHIMKWSMAIACATLLTACSTYDSTTQRIIQRITPYQITIVQGNFISREAIAKLHAGMGREQVRAVLGTPLVTDMFHSEQWDYIFYFKRGANTVVQQRHLVVYFERDRLLRWAGGEDLPSEYELLAEIDGDRHANTRSKQGAAVGLPRAGS